MKKSLLLLSVLAITIPAMADTAMTTTTTTKEFVPFTEAIDRAKLQEEADANYNAQTLQQQRNEVQRKVNQKKEVYNKQQKEQAKKRAELQKQNEERRQNVQSNINSRKSGLLYIQQNVKEDSETIRRNNAEIFTNLMNEVNGKTESNIEVNNVENYEE